MRIERGDVERYAEVFEIGKRAGWIISELKDGEGGIFEIDLARTTSGNTYGRWRGALTEFRKFGALTMKPETREA